MSRHDDAHIAETDVLAAELERAGLLTVTTRQDGEPIYTLTPKGAQLARQLALSDDPDGLLDALLEGGPSD